ncbi:unnamed protein product [Caenorhabditis auriculariae]|uniref:CWH43-like N-terminal domain-containing protein n=1 Tax=Caenorhabditis auriculariae TaxID=2777116 RepID=A0A8S1GP50_9PELO|nr:unnamed protein product [Caenorhabditis auriculariae]
MHPSYANRKIGYIRLALALFGTVCFFTAVSFGWYAAHVFHQYYPNLPTPRPWTSKMWQPGYNYHVRSAFAEWSMALSIVAYILSYSRDFEKFEAKLVVERLVVHLDHSPMANSYEDLRTKAPIPRAPFKLSAGPHCAVASVFQRLCSLQQRMRRNFDLYIMKGVKDYELSSGKFP